MDSINQLYVFTCIIMQLFTVEGQTLNQNNTGSFAQQNTTKKCTTVHTTSCRIMVILDEKSCLDFKLKPSDKKLIKSSLSNSAPYQLKETLGWLKFELSRCHHDEKDPCDHVNVKESNFDMIFGTILVLMMVTGISGNITVLIIIAKEKQLRSQVINWFLFSLAISDVLVCLITLPFRVSESFHNQKSCFSINACYIFIYTDIIANVSSTICVVYISINRYVAVSHPLTHSSYISVPRTVCMIVFCWCCSVGISIIPTVNWKTGRSSIMFTYRVCSTSSTTAANIVLPLLTMTPLLAIGVLYLLIFRIIKRRRAECPDQSRTPNLKRTEWRVTRTAVIVYTAFLISNLPSYVFSITMVLCESCSFIAHVKHPEIRLVMTRLLPLLSSVMNPFIYVLTGKRYKEALRKMCAHKREKEIPRQEQTDPTNSTQL